MAEGKYVSIAEVKEMLTAENEKRGELIPSLKAAMNTAVDTCPLSKEQADEIIAKVTEIIADLSLTEDSRAMIPVKIADTLPKYPVEVRAIFAKERGVTLSPDMIQQILDTVAEYAN
jgi:DNA-directed RNA polymerase subunit F